MGDLNSISLRLGSNNVRKGEAAAATTESSSHQYICIYIYIHIAGRRQELWKYNSIGKDHVVFEVFWGLHIEGGRKTTGRDI